MSTPIVTGPMRILRKLRQHRYLPVLRIESVMTDDDCDFHGDMLYFRGILEDIRRSCVRKPRRLDPFPSDMSTDLDTALASVRHDFVVEVTS